METTLENPVIKGPELDKLDSDSAEDKATEASLREAAQAADRDEAPSSKQSDPSADDRKENKQDSPSGDAPKDSNSDTRAEQERDEHGRFKSKEEKAAADAKEAEAQRQDGKGDSDYIKAKKEQERRDRSWKALEEEKARVRAEAERIERERQELQQRFSQNQPQGQGQQQSRYSADDYEQVALESWLNPESDDYDPQKGRAALLRAKQLREAESSQLVQSAFGNHEAEWVAGMQQTLASEAAFADPTTPEARELNALLEAEGQLFQTIPNGFAKAVEVTKLRLKAARVPELEEKITKLQAELDGERQNTRIDGSGPGAPRGEKAFNDMTPEEQEEHLRKNAQQLDRAA